MKYLVYAIVVVLVLASCAKKGTLTGGPKDEDPPVFVSASPEYETTNFDAKKIKITFNEYIKLDDVSKQLIVSPPLNYPSEITPLGSASKTITIKIKDTLSPETTYSFNFGNSVRDNAENNVYGNFKYVFSTGDYIDSLSINGSVNNAIGIAPAIESTIMLYPLDTTFKDSTVYKDKGLYVGNTLDSTVFNLSNIKDGVYQVIALQDKSSNYIYDPKEDLIGFLEKPLELPRDTTALELTLFKEILPFKLYAPKELFQGHIIFPFEGPLPNDLKLEILQPNTLEGYSMIKEADKDTLNFWYDRELQDSIQFKLSYQNQKIDTFTTLLRTKKFDSLTIKSLNRNILELEDDFQLALNQPLASIDSSLFSVKDIDSIDIPYKLDYIKESRRIKLQFDKQEKNEYRIEILPSAIKTLYQESLDTLNFKLRTRSLEDYGELSMSFKNDSDKIEQLIVELLSTKEEILRVSKTTSDQKVKWVNIKPGDYMVRVKVDENKNGIWDTGNFLERQQAEPVYYFPSNITVRANWSENEVLELID
ncbi:MAG: Ig-like domain-containing protein [Flavobacteriaceae bacterium]